MLLRATAISWEQQKVRMVNEIGETAGEIWIALSEDGKPATVARSKKKTKLPENMHYNRMAGR